ncbi:MAG: agmatinase [Prochlorococcus sp. SP3034]|nr:agmatinase [Prochlorococcus sp. SP3034]
MNHRKIFDNEGSLYMGSQRNIKESSIGIFGVNYDGTTSFKPGTRFGPNAIRNVSQSLETYCPRLDKDLSNIKYVDFGSLIIDLNNTESVIKKVSIATKALLENNLKPLMLGGEHSITTGAIEALVEKYPDLVLIQLDAHADLRESYLNNINSHACTMQRCIEKLPNKKIFQLGIRSGTKEEFKKMRENKQLIDFHEVNRESLLKALEKVKKFPIYLTIDLDWFDPSLLPGTGTPEPGGFFWNDFEVVVETLNNFNLIGADIVELSPEIDLSGVSSIVAAKVTRSLIMTLDN